MTRPQHPCFERPQLIVGVVFGSTRPTISADREIGFDVGG